MMLHFITNKDVLNRLNSSVECLPISYSNQEGRHKSESVSRINIGRRSLIIDGYDNEEYRSITRIVKKSKYGGKLRERSHSNRY